MHYSTLISNKLKDPLKIHPQKFEANHCCSFRDVEKQKEIHKRQQTQGDSLSHSLLLCGIQLCKKFHLKS